MRKMKKTLGELDGLIKFYEELTQNWPACTAYQKTLATLRQERVTVTNSIGRGRK